MKVNAIWNLTVSPTHKIRMSGVTKLAKPKTYLAPGIKTNRCAYPGHDKKVIVTMFLCQNVFWRTSSAKTDSK